MSSKYFKITGVIRISLVAIFVMGMQNPVNGQRASTELPVMQGSDGSGYTMLDSTLFYGGSGVKGAKPYAFKDLGDGFGADDKHVYYKGKIFEGLSPSDFPSRGNAADGQQIRDSVGGNNVDRNSSASTDGQQITPATNSSAAGSTTSPLSTIGDEQGPDARSAVTGRGGNVQDRYGNQHRPGHGENGHEVVRSGYSVQRGGVFYLGERIRSASPDTFVDLGDEYAKDRRAVYYCGKVIRGASPTFFETEGRGYARDNRFVYLLGVRIDPDMQGGMPYPSGGSNQYAEALGGGYSRDARAVYFQGARMVDASPRSFEHLGGGYGCDERFVFFQGGLLRGAAARSFRYEGEGYASDEYATYFNGEPYGDNAFGPGGHDMGYTKDSWSVYYGRHKVEDATASSFTDLGDGYGKDAFSVFFQGIEVEDATAMNFKNLGGGYAKDAFSVFYRGIEMGDATANSFQSLGRGYAKDTWNVYYRGRKMNGVSPANFVVPHNRPR